MVTESRSWIRVMRWLRFLLDDTAGTQIVEFAVVLPLLMVVTVGIYDFGSAFTVKEKLVTIAQTGARVGASQPGNDLTKTAGGCAQLISVCAIRDVVDRGLLDARMNDCGLASAAPVSAGAGTLTWTVTANSGCPAALVLKIERGYFYNTALSTPFAPPATNPYHVIATKVTLSYPYQWQFNQVIGLLGGTFSGPAQIKTVAVMQNLN
jgi:Flp pilus assembly protein TadG